MPSRRPYDMTVRAASAARTRERIVAAAVAVYAREGFKNASMQSIAREAGVSPATVLNHFATAEEILVAAVDFLYEDMAVPQARDLEAIDGLEARLGWLVRELNAYFDRTQSWYVLFERERDVPALQEGAQRFYRHLRDLVQAALGPDLQDRRSLAVVMSLVGTPNTVRALQASGMSPRQAVDTMVEVLLSWLQRPLRADRETIARR
jgi:AcrR family transcriptional regulator